MIKTDIENAVHLVLKDSLHPDRFRGTKTALEFNLSIPFLSKNELGLIKYILTSKLAPWFGVNKDTGKYCSISKLLIPSDYNSYTESGLNKQNYSRVKNSLIDKRVIYETEYGFVLNHVMFPFKDDRKMSKLKSYVNKPLKQRLPLPPK